MKFILANESITDKTSMHEKISQKLSFSVYNSTKF